MPNQKLTLPHARLWIPLVYLPVFRTPFYLPSDGIPDPWAPELQPTHRLGNPYVRAGKALILGDLRLCSRRP